MIRGFGTKVAWLGVGLLLFGCGSEPVPRAGHGSGGLGAGPQATVPLPETSGDALPQLREEIIYQIDPERSMEVVADVLQRNSAEIDAERSVFAATESAWEPESDAPFPSALFQAYSSVIIVESDLVFTVISGMTGTEVTSDADGHGQLYVEASRAGHVETESRVFVDVPECPGALTLPEPEVYSSRRVEFVCEIADASFVFDARSANYERVTGALGPGSDSEGA